MRTLDLDSLRTFLACAAAPSFADAGVRVHKSQSTVSMQMRKLEETVGQPLFVKRGRKNALTAAGTELAEYAARMLRLNDDALNRFRPREFAGRIAIGTPDDYAEAFLPAVLARFGAHHRDVEVTLECRSSAEIAAMTKAGELDLGVVTMDEATAAAGARPIHTEGLAWACPLDARVELERPLPLALWQPGCCWRALTVSALETADIPYRVAYSGVNAGALRTAVQAGLAVTAVPTRFLGDRLRILAPGDALPPLGTFQIGLMTSNAAPLTTQFADEVEAAFVDLRPLALAA